MHVSTLALMASSLSLGYAWVLTSDYTGNCRTVYHRREGDTTECFNLYDLERFLQLSVGRFDTVHVETFRDRECAGRPLEAFDPDKCFAAYYVKNGEAKSYKSVRVVVF